MVINDKLIQSFNTQIKVLGKLQESVAAALGRADDQSQIIAGKHREKR